MVNFIKWMYFLFTIASYEINASFLLIKFAKSTVESILQGQISGLVLPNENEEISIQKLKSWAIKLNNKYFQKTP